MALPLIATYALDVAGYEHGLEPNAPAVRQSLELVAKAGAALFAAGPSGAAHVARWRQAFYAAACVGDERSLGRLADTPCDALRASPIRCDEYNWPFVEALSDLARGRDAARIQANLLDALERATEPRLVHEDVDFVLHLVVSEMELAYRVATRDEEQFASSLATTLTYRKYWTTLAEEGPDYPGALLALGPSAICSMARASGMSVVAASEYLFVHQTK